MNVQVLIGMETWEETTLVADISSKTQMPVISFASAAIKQPLIPQRWPFLVQMASNIIEQIRCITDMVRSFNWRRAIVIYEVDYYGSDSGMFAALSDSLQDVGVTIEYRLILPSFSSLDDPKAFVSEAVADLLSKKSRVFIVLQLSSSMIVHLFREVKQMRLIGRDSAWIITDRFASLLDSANTSVISSMEGALGIKTYYAEGSRSFLDIKQHFRRVFQLDYPEEDNSEMGIYALRAYDSIIAITNAIKRIGNSSDSPSTLLKSILSSNFTGLSGDIRFHAGELAGSSLFRIVNIVGKRYKELGFWSSRFGFSESLVIEESGHENITDGMEALSSLVNWPGDLKRVPKGWAMPTDAKPMKIGVPTTLYFHKFVKNDWDASLNEWKFSGFCIDLFYEVLKILEQSYPLPYELKLFKGNYNDLVDQVANKIFDAVIGDITILANRSKYVEFTQPYFESSLSMIVTTKPQRGLAWIFVKPFTKKMWAVTGAILIYTVFIVWLLERQSNPEFEGPWQNQLGTALWFTSSTLFSAQREKVHNSYTRIVVLVWLFVVLALSSSYTANLSSMLTVQRLQPNVTDIDWLKKNNATVGCGGNTFIRSYLENVLKFHPRNIKTIRSKYDYPGEFQSGNISAAFFELPYAKEFLNYYCKGYTLAEHSVGAEHRFGGLGFVFPKGSPIAVDFSQAILNLLENGRIEQLQTQWFTPPPKCLNSQTPDEVDSLNWRSFWGLFLFSALTSTICYIVFATHQLYGRQPEAYDGVLTWNYKNMFKKLVRSVQNLRIRETKLSGITPNNTVQALEACASPLEIPEQFQELHSIEVEITNPNEEGTDEACSAKSVYSVKIEYKKQRTAAQNRGDSSNQKLQRQGVAIQGCRDKIDEAIAIQGNNDIEPSAVEDHQAKHVVSEGLVVSGMILKAGLQTGYQRAFNFTFSTHSFLGAKWY
ncbi:unnamed protein product [Ilex paraguariensis]|uniref:Glutamate receptor n=1 Tax=Ilex paraguariensis TaxID=185542 RepID=A0ABC8SYI7_9AQUA